MFRVGRHPFGIEVVNPQNLIDLLEFGTVESASEPKIPIARGLVFLIEPTVFLMQRLTPHRVVMRRVASQHRLYGEFLEIVSLRVFLDIFPALIGLVHDVAVSVHQVDSGAF